MEHYAAIDVSLEWSSICIVDPSGRIAYVGNRAFAETFEPGLVSDDAPFAPPWTRNILHAVQLIDYKKNLRALEAYSRDTVTATAPDKYAEFNEAGRDKAFMRHTLEFMLQYPLITLQAAVVKSVRFLYPPACPASCSRASTATGDWLYLIPAAVNGIMAVLGVAIGLKQRRVRALGLMAVSYVAVYALTYPLFYRYRYPIEPLLAVLGGVAVASGVQFGLRSRVTGPPELGGGRSTGPPR